MRAGGGIDQHARQESGGLGDHARGAPPATAGGIGDEPVPLRDVLPNAIARAAALVQKDQNHPAAIAPA